MLKIDSELTIHINRGDSGILKISALNKDGSTYKFNDGDIVRFGVFTKKNYNDIKIQKDIEAEAGSEYVIIELSDEDTRITDDIINKPLDFWYEVQLNPTQDTQTIIGYDENGPKIFKLYPEGAELE